MIKLKNVSKYYYGKGVVSSGFTKVNLELLPGEFVVITGESGSGKSTLLNVISGVDSYEDGEMFIDGKETSHYTEIDYENYRRKYIGNIFQNFNLVNSYTVYQNVELSLLINGEKGKDVKTKVHSLLEKVGLTKYTNTKVSKLSGGQKQRVAIARALAKDTPIIIADEPTGNLDKKSAETVMKMLSDISKEKLVIIVTHNYEQVEQYATRKIRMHDGKIHEDKKIKEANKIEKLSTVSLKNMSFLSKLKIGTRNCFNIIPKFVLIYSVFILLTFFVLSRFGSNEESNYKAKNVGYNGIFRNSNVKRIVLKKEDKSSISKEEIEQLKKMNNIEKVVENDLMVESTLTLTDFQNEWISTSIIPIEEFKNKVDIGRLPENDNEIVMYGNKNHWVIRRFETIKDVEFYVDEFGQRGDNNIGVVKIVGVIYKDNNSLKDDNSNLDIADIAIYAPQKFSDALKYSSFRNSSKSNAYFQDKWFETNHGNYSMPIRVSTSVPSGNVYIPESYTGYCKDGNCINRPLKLTTVNPYFSDEINLTVTQVYKKDNVKKLLGIDKLEETYNSVFINPNDYNKMFEKNSYQSSVFVKDIEKLDETLNKLTAMGYNALPMKYAFSNYGQSQLMKILNVVLFGIVYVVLFFISYFVIKIVLKSRNIYYATLRVLGATKNLSNQLLIVELFTSLNLGFFTVVGAIATYDKIPILKDMNAFVTMNQYITFTQYILLYFLLILMVFVISQKFAKSLFKKSAIQTLKEEV